MINVRVRLMSGIEETVLTKTLVTLIFSTCFIYYLLRETVSTIYNVHLIGYQRRSVRKTIAIRAVNKMKS